MPFFRYRPFALFCLAFSAAVCCAELLSVRLSPPLLIIAGVLFSLFSGLFLIFRKKRFSRFFLRPAVCIVFALLGLLVYFVSVTVPERALTESDEPRETALIIEEKLYDSFAGTAYKARVYKIDGERARGKVLFTCQSDYFESGAVVETVAVFYAAEKVGDFDKYTYAHSHGMLACADTAEGEEALWFGTKLTLQTASARLRAKIAERIEAASEGKDGGICAALLCGMRSGIGDAEYLDFTRAGILHMLAISGMHFTVLMGGIGFLLQKIRLKKSARLMILFLCALLYTAIAGFSHSVLRAAFMLFAVYTAYFIGRERDVYTSLFSSAALILAAEPTAAASVGLWLSVFAAFGVIFASEITRKRKRSGGKARHILAECTVTPIFIGACAQLASLPITFLTFGEVAVLSPLSTLLCTLPVNILLFASVLLAAVGTPIPLVTDAVVWLCRALTDIARFFSDSASPYTLNYPFTPYIVALTVLLTVAAAFGAKRTRKLFFALALAALVSMPVCTALYEAPSKDTDTVYAKSYGKNDIILFSGADGRAIVDVTNGSGTAADCAEAMLYEMHRTDADTLVLTRLNKATAEAVTNYCTAFKVRAVYCPEPDNGDEEEFAELVKESAALARTSLVYYRFGEAFYTAGIYFTVHSEAAEHSTVPIRAVSARTGEKSVLYVSSGITHSKHILQIRDAASKADLLIIGAAGPKNKLPLHFTAKCPTVLPSKETLEEASEKYKALLDSVEVYYSNETFEFCINNED